MWQHLGMQTGRAISSESANSACGAAECPATQSKAPTCGSRLPLSRRWASENQSGPLCFQEGGRPHQAEGRKPKCAPELTPSKSHPPREGLGSSRQGSPLAGLVHLGSEGEGPPHSVKHSRRGWALDVGGRLSPSFRESAV